MRWRHRAAAAAWAGTLLFGTAGILTLWDAGPSMAAPAPSGWTATQAPTPSGPDAPSGTAFDFKSESCASAVFCSAVGSYEDSSFGSHGVLDVLVGGSWNAIEAPLPAGVVSTNVGINAVSCPSQGWCVAIGDYEDASHHFFTVVETYTGGSWSATRAVAPSDSNGTDEELNSVSCPASGTCFAIGGYSVTLSSFKGYIDTLSGGTWTAQTAPMPMGSTLAPGWNVISCPSTTFCGAASSLLIPNLPPEGTPAVPVLYRMSGGTWTSQIAPLPGTAGSSGTDFSNIDAISCANASCEASGYFDDTSGGQQVLLEQLSGTNWSASSGPLPASHRTPDPSAEAAAVSCSFDGYCAAVGQYRDSGDSVQPLLESIVGGSASVQAVPLPTGAEAGGAVLAAVSCLAVDSCAAVGSHVPALNQTAGLIVQLSGTTWSAQAAPVPANYLSPRAVSLAAVTCTYRGACDAAGTYPTQSGGSIVGLLDSYAPPQGYWSAAADGGVFTYGSAVFHGSMGGQHINAPVVGMAETPGPGGYWEAGADGGVYSFGNATFHGSAGGLHLNAPVVGMAATPSGLGYWLVASDGGIFNYGDAGFFGSRGGQPLNKPIVGIAPTPDGRGYWLVASDGGVFNYGDAGFYGSRGGQPLNKPVVGIASSATGLGYWLVASDGGIFNYGDAAFAGSAGAIHLNKPVVGMMSTFDGAGYWLIASDGGIFSYGDAGFQGSAGSLHLNAPVTGGAPS